MKKKEKKRHERTQQAITSCDEIFKKSLQDKVIDSKV